MQKLINKPNFERVKKYLNDLVAFQMMKQKVVLNKPRYVGAAVLNLSKYIMYDFHYNYIMRKFPHTKLLFTDTDSFCYHIKTPKDFYEEIRGEDWFDFSNYDPEHRNYSTSSYLIPGKFKDELGGIAIREF